jgi:hypothetical protein
MLPITRRKIALVKVVKRNEEVEGEKGTDQNLSAGLLKEGAIIVAVAVEVATASHLKVIMILVQEAAVVQVEVTAEVGLRAEVEAKARNENIEVVSIRKEANQNTVGRKERKRIRKVIEAEIMMKRGRRRKEAVTEIRNVVRERRMNHQIVIVMTTVMIQM